LPNKLREKWAIAVLFRWKPRCFIGFALFEKKEGLLVPMVDSAVRRRMKKLRLASKVNPPTNALRHSFASYWLACSSKEGLGEFSKRMGNSEAVCKRHYLETLTREEGLAWFKIRRSKSDAEPVSVVSAKAA
jgi:hypothetical protein